MKPILCPHCESSGWPSALNLGLAAAICGSTWESHHADPIVTNPTPACVEIASLRRRLKLRAVA